MNHSGRKIIEHYENSSLKNKELAKEMIEMLADRELKFWHEKDS